MKKCKKILSLALTLTMLAGTLLSTSAFAAGADDDYGCYSNDDGSINIVRYYGSNTDLVIPDTLKDRPVTVISSLKSGNYACYVENVTLPANLLRISAQGVNDFGLQCENLKSVTFNQKLQRIDHSAFRGDKNLTKIFLPNSLTDMGSWAFYGCTGLEDLTLSSGLKEITESSFEYCSSLSKVAIPSGVTTIDQNAFAWCTSLSEVTIPASVTNMSDSAFANCDSLSIKGYNGTYAQTYAKAHNIPFVSLGNVPIDTSIQLDTGSALSIKAGKFYTFRVTAKSRPTFTVGNNSVFKITYTGSAGNNYFFKANAVGKAGQATGFYINQEKTPRTIGTIR